MAVNVNTCMAFENTWKLWRLCGFQPPQSGSRWRIPYLVYAVCLNVTSTLLIPTTLVINCALSRNLDELCEGLYIATAVLACSVKYTYTFLKRRNLLRVHPLLTELDQRAYGPDEKVVLQSGVNTAKRWLAAYSSLTAIGCTFYILVAYFSSGVSLLYPGWFPWDWQKHRFLTCAYQVYGMGVLAAQNVTIDMYPQAYLCILTSHIKALGLRIQKLGNGQRHHSWNQHSTAAAVVAAAQQSNYKNLIACIEDHQKIIEAFSLMERTISLTSFFQFIETGQVLCTMGVYALSGHMNASRMVVHLALFGSVATLEAFIFCYFGDLLCEESENLTHQIYACNWMDQNMEFKKALLLLLQRSQKLNKVLAGNIIPLELPTFVQLMKTSYSVFTVFKNIK